MMFFPNRGQQLGCTSCDDGYTKVYSVFWNKKICGESKRLKNKMISRNLMDHNCLNFTNNSSFTICTKCSSGYILSYPDGKCFSNSFISNCEIAYNQRRCKVCSSGYILSQSGTCTLSLVENCSVFLADQTPAKCLTCNNKYYNFKGICILGMISNCEIYDFKTQCAKCETGYLLMIDEDKTSCIEDAHDSKCTNQSVIQHKFEVHCNECASDYLDAYHVDLTPFYHYWKFNDIDNCKNYSDSSHKLIEKFKTRLKDQMTIQILEQEYSKLISEETNSPSYGIQSSFCIECDDEYYLDLNLNSCISIEKTISNCQIYGKLSNSCITCEDSYLLTEDNLLCVPRLKTILNCHEYRSPTLCKICNNSYYPKDNTCVPVPINFQTNNCSLYNEDLNCVECLPGFLLVNNQCTSLQVSNCKTFANHKQCLSCEENHILHILQSGMVTCELKSIPFCIESTGHSSFDDISIDWTSSEYEYSSWCLQCEPNYYPANGVCLPASIQIPNCKINSTSNSCKVCDFGYILSSSRKKCISKNSDIISSIFTNENNLIGPNCSEMSHSENAVCLLCKKGFLLYQGECRACGGEGCMQCHPDDARKCSICEQGYVMVSKGVCLKV